MTTTPTKYLVKTGLDFERDGTPVRVEPGETLTAADLPEGANIDHLLARGHLVLEPKKKAAKKAVN